MQLQDVNRLNEKTVVDSKGKSIGRVTDILGSWLEDPTYVEITITSPIFWFLGRNSGSTCILFPISEIVVEEDFIRLDRSRGEIFRSKEYAPSVVMESEGYQIGSKIVRSAPR